MVKANRELESYRPIYRPQRIHQTDGAIETGPGERKLRTELKRQSPLLIQHFLHGRDGDNRWEVLHIICLGLRNRQITRPAGST